jgi:hypothetical protein
MQLKFVSGFIFLLLAWNLTAQDLPQVLPLPLNTGSFENKVGFDGTNISKEEVISHLEYLSSDKLMGRRTGEPGNIKARNYIVDYFLSNDLEVVLQPFSFSRRNREYDATNIIVTIKGTENPEQYIAITAHYDHEGVGKPIAGDSIYNGADDNASGTAALMVIAKYFKENPPKNSLIFLALDAEELGLQGAKYFVENKGEQNILLNINMDMISRNDNNEIYVAGTRFTPSLRDYFNAIPKDALPIKVNLGHDGLDGKSNWTTQSDHFHFYRNNIPFLYFGVEDHDDYHKPSDTFDKIPQDFYHNVVQFIANTIADLDSKL